MATEQFDIETEELEFKYSSEDIKLTDFVKFAESHNPKKRLEVASWDVYYNAPTGRSFEFIRLRGGPGPELTIKKKRNEKNNNRRFELDMRLAPNAPFWEAETFVDEMGA